MPDASNAKQEPDVQADIHPGNEAISRVMRFLLERGYVIIAPNGELVKVPHA